MATTRIRPAGIECATRVLAAVVAFSAVGAAHAQDARSDVSGYVTLASGYWKRGLAQTDDASLQLGLDYQHHTGFFTYARAMNVDYPQNLPDQTRNVEVTTHVGYHDRTERWSWTASVGRYFYPDASAYDYDEASVGFGFRDRIFYSVSYIDEYYVRSSAALNQEISFAVPLRGDLEIGGTLGYFEVAEDYVDITHWNLGVSKLFRRMALDVRYYDGNYEQRNFLGDPYADRYVLSLSYALRASPGRAMR
jgi:uncharacterized protein (TIGR02001 family)